MKFCGLEELVLCFYVSHVNRGGIVKLKWVNVMIRLGSIATAEIIRVKNGEESANWGVAADRRHRIKI